MANQFLSSLLSKLSQGNKDSQKNIIQRNSTPTTFPPGLPHLPPPCASGYLENHPSFLSKMTLKLVRTRKQAPVPSVSRPLPPLPLHPHIHGHDQTQAQTHHAHASPSGDHASRSSIKTGTVRRKPVSYARSSTVAAAVTVRPTIAYSNTRDTRTGTGTGAGVEAGNRTGTGTGTIFARGLVTGGSSSNGTTVSASEFPRPLPIPPLKTSSFPKRNVPMK